MALTDYLDKGSSLGRDAPCLVAGERILSYGDAQDLSWQVADALRGCGVGPGDKVAVLSANDPIAFACVFGISRRGAVWCPINPRNEAAENRDLLDLFDCRCLIFQGAFGPLVSKIAQDLPRLTALVCLDDDDTEVGVPFDQWLTEGATQNAVRNAVPNAVPDAAPNTVRNAVADVAPNAVRNARPDAAPNTLRNAEPNSVRNAVAEAAAPEDIVMIVGTGGTTGKPKGVVLTDRNIETMSALTLMSYPFSGRPTYLALAPLTHAAGVLCFPVMALGGRVVIMAKPDLTEFLRLVAKHRITHTFLPPTLIYQLLGHPDVRSTDLGSLQCFWYGAAPMSVARLEDALEVFGPVMAQLFGQSEAPMMISTMAPADHFLPDGSVARTRLSSAGRPSPLVTVGIMDEHGTLLAAGQRGEIVVRSSLVMAGYYKDPTTTEEVSRHGWHHTGDIGYLDEDNYLYIVDRAKDMIITGGFNVYSAEVEQALMKHPDVIEAAVVGLPDDKWGERVTAVIQLRADSSATPQEITDFVKAQVGSVKTPKQVEFWPDLPRSKVGKVLKHEVRRDLLATAPDRDSP